MSLQISIFERTGSPFVDEEVFNSNWKNQGLKDSLFKYYYYPIRRPEDDDWVKHSATKYLYAKIEGTYSQAKRVRWKITGLSMTDGVRLYMAQTHTYAVPTTDFAGNLIYGERDPLYIYPNLSTVGPTDADTRLSTLSSDTTYYTDFIMSQLWVDDTSGYVGNSDIIDFKLEVDEYE